ncbi:MAG: hypothetical protein QOF94_2262, partial [Acidobacteriaceae bacterium]
HDFNALAEQWTHARGVIGTEIGDIKNFCPIVQDTDAIVGLATNHRPACARGKPTGGNPRLGPKRIAERWRGLLFQIVLIEDGDGLRFVGFALLNGAAGNDDAFGLGGGSRRSAPIWRRAGGWRDGILGTRAADCSCE